jgi:hypothetical protein
MAAKTSKFRNAVQVMTVSKALTSSCTIACWALAVLIFMATVVSFTQSYRGLLAFATNYLGIPAPFNWTWPIMVDTFLAAGEIGLFICAVQGVTITRIRLWLWALTTAGLAVSVVGNAAHGSQGLHAPLLKMTGYAVPPLAAVLILGIGLGFVKRAVTRVNAGEGKHAVEVPGVPARPAPQKPNWTAPPRPAPKPKPAEDELTRRRRSRKRLLDSDPRLQAIVLELRGLFAAGERLTDRKVQEKFGVSRHMGGVLITAAREKPQEAASG